MIKGMLFSKNGPIKGRLLGKFGPYKGTFIAKKFLAKHKVFFLAKILAFVDGIFYMKVPPPPLDLITSLKNTSTYS